MHSCTLNNTETREPYTGEDTLSLHDALPILFVCRKDWGIESFVSSTLLRNMREKDLRKAISYHMKKILVQEPKQKVCLYRTKPPKAHGGWLEVVYW